jgi:hypothetical protein
MLCLMLALSVAVAAPSLAELYQYRTPDGRLIISNSPPPAGTQVESNAAEGTGATTHTTTELPPVQPWEPPAAAEPDTPTEPETSTAQPVDTLQFGLLQRGMSRTEVRRRLGPPERVETATEEARVRRGNRMVIDKDQLEWWYYPGAYGVPRTRLFFRNGRLVGKNR